MTKMRPETLRFVLTVACECRKRLFNVLSESLEIISSTIRSMSLSWQAQSGCNWPQQRQRVPRPSAHLTTDKKCRAQKRGKEQQWVHLVDEVDRAASIPLPSVLGPALVRAWKALTALEGAWEALQPGGPGIIFLLWGCACVHQSKNG